MLTNALENIMRVMGNNQVAGEKPAVGKTATFEFSVERKEKEQLSNMDVGGGKATLPSASDLFGNMTVEGNVDVQVIGSFLPPFITATYLV